MKGITELILENSEVYVGGARVSCPLTYRTIWTGRLRDVWGWARRNGKRLMDFRKDGKEKLCADRNDASISL